MTNHDIPNLTSLLIHEDFLRRIARSILSDADSANDAVQETWLRAVRSPPRDPHHSRAWLAVVTSNVAKSFRRKESVAQRTLHSVPTSEVTGAPEPAAILEREAVRKRVVDAVLALEPKLRDVVLLMYFEGLTPTRGARRLGIPHNTFLSRVHRARAELRRKLVDDTDDRERSATLIGALAGLDRPIEIPAWSGLRIAGVAALAATVVGFVFYSMFLPQAARPVSPTTTPAVSRVEPPSPAPVEPVRAAAPAPRIAVAKTFDIRGSVRDASGMRIAGARISAETSSGRVEATSQKDGRFVLALAKPESVDLWVESPQHLGLRCLAHPSEELDLVLLRGIPLRGIVRDAIRGQAIADARIAIESSAGQPPAQQATSDAEGAFAFMAPTRSLDLVISKSGYESSRRLALTPNADEEVKVELSPSIANSVAFVRVLDLDGLPVRAIGSPYGTPRAVGDGIFEIQVVARGGSPNGSAAGSPPSNFPQSGSPASSRGVLWHAEDGVPQTIRIEANEGKTQDAPAEIRLPRRASIHGSVVDGAGGRVPGARIILERVVSSRRRVAPSSPVRIEGTGDAKGEFRFDDLSEASEYRLAVSAASGSLRRQEPIVAVREPKPLEVVLDSGVKIAGRVVDASNAPVRGARLTVRGTRTASDKGGLEIQSNSSSAVATTSMVIDDGLAVQRVGFTDENGRFDIEHIPTDARIEVTALGHAFVRDLDLAAVRAEAESGALTITLGVEHVLVGKLESRAGLPLAGGTVIAQRMVSTGNGASFGAFSSDPWAPPATHADGRLEELRSHDSARFETTSRPDGSFEIRGLSADTYSLSGRFGAGTSEGDFTPAKAQPRNAAKKHTLTLFQPSTIHGRAVDSLNGSALTDYSQSLESVTSRTTESSYHSGGQYFQYTLQEGDVADLTLRTGQGDRLVAHQLAPTPGDSREVILELPASRPRDAAGGALELTAELKGASGLRVGLIPVETVGTTLRVGVIGTSSFQATLLELSTGKYRITLHDAKETQFYCDPETVEIKAGAVAKLTLKPR